MKTTDVYYFTFSSGQKFRSSLTEFPLQELTQQQSKCWAGLGSHVRPHQFLSSSGDADSPFPAIVKQWLPASPRQAREGWSGREESKVLLLPRLEENLNPVGKGSQGSARPTQDHLLFEYCTVTLIWLHLYVCKLLQHVSSCNHGEHDCHVHVPSHTEGGWQWCWVCMLRRGKLGVLIKFCSLCSSICHVLKCSGSHFLRILGSICTGFLLNFFSLTCMFYCL